jgi:uncharacterized protein YdbL (DUF1318 family)
MTRTTLTMTALLTLLLTTLALGQGNNDAEKARLQDRFKQRYPTLTQLQKAGQVGETYLGLAEVTPQGDGSAKAGGGHGGQTVRQFVDEENTDRKRLYELLAAETGATPQQVAQRDANRRFQKAEPEDWLMIREGRWVQKKDVRAK